MRRRKPRGIFRRKVRFIRKIAKRTVMSCAESKQYVSLVYHSYGNQYGSPGFRTVVFPVNGPAFNYGGSNYASGPVQGVYLGGRIGNKIWSRGCRFSIYLQPIIYVSNRTCLPIRFTYLYFRKPFLSATNVTGNSDILNVVNAITDVSPWDGKTVTVIKDKKMVFYPQNIANAANGQFPNVLYRTFWLPFKYKKTFTYQVNADFDPNNCTYLFCITFPYASPNDQNDITFDVQQSFYFKDV